MNSFMGISGWELLILALVFLVIVGPQRLPDFTRTSVRYIRQLRRWVDESKAAVENEMGIAVDDLKKYDPRQYDPRRIIREAWGDTTLDDLLPSKEAMSITAGGAAASGAAAAGTRAKSTTSTSGLSAGPTIPEGPLPTPFDDEAT